MSGYMVGWDGPHETGKRPAGIHPLASIGCPPENRHWMVGDHMQAPQIAPSALIHAFCTIDAGMPGAPTTTIGERTFLQARVHLGHNAVVGDDCELCAGVVICGHVTIGNGVTIAGNSWVRNRLTIGDGAYIGGGSVVTKDVPAHEVWCGNPARFLKLAKTHPDCQAAPEPQWNHPLRDTEEVWANMAPWHRRDLERRNQQLVDEMDAQRHLAWVEGDIEAATTSLNKHEAICGRVGTP